MRALLGGACSAAFGVQAPHLAFCAILPNFLGEFCAFCLLDFFPIV